MNEHAEIKDFLIDKSKIDWVAVGKDLKALREAASLT